MTTLREKLQMTEPHERARRAFNELSRCLNSGGSQNIQAALFEYLDNEHPTLQQEFMRSILIPALQYFAGMEWVDARNEGSQKLARKMLEPVGDSYHLPLI